jgi:hypothetical protein
LYSNNEYNIENLVDTIEELELGQYFNLELNNLPNSIKIIKFTEYAYYNKELNSLVDSIEYLKLPPYYDKKILCVPKSLKKIRCSKKYEFINAYEPHIKIEIYDD